VLHRLAEWFALAGGVVLVLMTLLVVVSVLGRALFTIPVPGDFEIVGIGTCVAIYLFLPYCYLQGGNVTVDILVGYLPQRAQHAFDMLAALVFAAVAGLFAWRMLFGLADTFHYGDISMIVGLPLWWTYPFGVASFGLMAVSAVWVALSGEELRRE
jgi:TRAP-type C4-dicarboxylate transport system permease small subunit